MEEFGLHSSSGERMTITNRTACVANRNGDGFQKVAAQWAKAFDAVRV